MSWPAWLTPPEVRFDKTPIWVSVESIPTFYWNLSNLKDISAKASPVYELPNGVEDDVGMSTLRKSLRFPPLLQNGSKTGCSKNKDPVLCNQLKVQKAIRNGESDEMRECRLQLLSKRRIVSDDENEDQDGGEPTQVITQLPLVYLPGIGEIAPYSNNNKNEVIQDLIDAAQPSNTTENSIQGNTTGCKPQRSQNNSSKIQNAPTKVTSLGGTKMNAGKEPMQTPSQVDQPATDDVSSNTTPCMKSHSRSSKDKQQRDSNEGTYFNPSYRASPLGSQTQFISWPSNECWAQAKARELFMGSLTVDKFHREPTLFNPLLSIEDFRVEEHLKGPRKRKAYDGFLFRLSPKSTSQTKREFTKEEPNSNTILCMTFIHEAASDVNEAQPPPTPAPLSRAMTLTETLLSEEEDR
uniref:DUF4283 domain-containing protein n=1 Tax=Cannabis sativa TaxID=3483 RepID=A0A803NT05_CANSA